MSLKTGKERLLDWKEKGILFELKDDGVHLTLTDESLPDKAEFTETLSRLGLSELDSNLLNRIYIKGEKKVFLGSTELLEPFIMDSVISVKVPKDKSKAEIMLSRPSLGGKMVSPEDILEELSLSNVQYGIDIKEIQDICTSRLFEKYIVVARQTDPVDGKDAKTKILVDFEPDYRPSIDELDKADYKNLKTLCLVKKQEVLAEKIPCEKGIDGKDITGITIYAKTGKDKKLPKGKGTEVSKDGLRLYSCMDGHAVIQDERINVFPVLHIKNNIDFKTGNIDFSGSVYIEGSVKNGFTVHSGDDVTVNGVIEGAVLTSKKNATVLGGIWGMNKGKIEAEGTITIGFADQSFLFSKEDILVSSTLSHSICKCPGRIVVCGSLRSQIVGGKIHAGKELYCLNLGNEIGVKTEVSIGLSSEYISEKNSLEEMIEKHERDLQNTELNMRYLKLYERQGPLQKDKRDILLNLTKTLFTLKKEIDEKRKKIESIDKKIAESKNEGIVRVKGTCFPGVVISMRGIIYRVEQPLKNCSFIYDEGKIVVGAFYKKMEEEKTEK